MVCQYIILTLCWECPETPLHDFAKFTPFDYIDKEATVNSSENKVTTGPCLIPFVILSLLRE